MLMERGHNDEKQHKHNVLRFTRKNRMSVFLEPNMIRGYAYGFMCNPVWKWIMERYDHNSIYTGYIQGGLGAINLDSPLTASTGI